MYFLQLKDYLLSNNGTAVAVSNYGRIRFFDDVDLSSMKKDENWSTYFNLK